VTIAIGVLARAPVPGRVKTRLLAAHEGAWVAGLYAAMLRDTLDGLQMVTASAYVVLAREEEGLEVLARHVPTPWDLRAGPSAVDEALATLHERADVAVIAGSDAPSFPTEPLVEALEGGLRSEDVVVGPSESGGLYLIATRVRDPRLLRDIPLTTPAALDVMRVRCKELGLQLRELPRWYQVREPSDVLALLDEMRKHPDRAPRTAQFLVTRA
jgi:glycosyltransferase A (GT-A) superfamily protein (DUF2064 family)